MNYTELNNEELRRLHPKAKQATALTALMVNGLLALWPLGI